MANKKNSETKPEITPEVMEMHAQMFEKERAERELREKTIAQCNQIFGQITATRMLVKFGQVANLTWIKQVKATKAYKHVPGIGTWAKFCKHLGYSESDIKRKLRNLNTFGEQLLRHMADFKVGYRELRKLRFAVADGKMAIEDDVLKIGDETIPIDDDHKEDLKAAIDTLLDEKDDLNNRIGKMKKEHEAILQEETRSLKSERDMAIEENKRLKAFAPDDNPPETVSLDQMKEIHKVARQFSLLCSRFMMDDRLKDDYPLQGEVLGQITAVSNCFRELERQWDLKFYVQDED